MNGSLLSYTVTYEAPAENEDFPFLRDSFVRTTMLLPETSDPTGQINIADTSANHVSIGQVIDFSTCAESGSNNSAVSLSAALGLSVSASFLF